jgi:hypothetical protein
MACADVVSMPDDEADLVRPSLHLRPEGGFDYEQMAENSDALRELLVYAANFADEDSRLLALIGVTLGVWEGCCSLAVGQLHRNLRRKASAPSGGSAGPMGRAPGRPYPP